MRALTTKTLYYMENQQVEKRIIEFFTLVERVVQRMEYGTLTVNVILSDGLPVVSSINIVRCKRKRYKVDKFT